MNSVQALWESQKSHCWVPFSWKQNQGKGTQSLCAENLCHSMAENCKLHFQHNFSGGQSELFNDNKMFCLKLLLTMGAIFTTLLISLEWHWLWLTFTNLCFPPFMIKIKIMVWFIWRGDFCWAHLCHWLSNCSSLLARKTRPLIQSPTTQGKRCRMTTRKQLNESHNEMVNRNSRMSKKGRSASYVKLSSTQTTTVEMDLFCKMILQSKADDAREIVRVVWTLLVDPTATKLLFSLDWHLRLILLTAEKN